MLVACCVVLRPSSLAWSRSFFRSPQVILIDIVHGKSSFCLFPPPLFALAAADVRLTVASIGGSSDMVVLSILVQL